MTKLWLRVGTALFCAAMTASAGDRAIAQGPVCPCTIWPPSAAPGSPAVTDGQPIETGVKFRSDVDGFVTAIRFYKGVQNTGTHVGHLWSAAGILLAEATFTDETASGWQEVQLSPAVAIAANTTYVASYHADSGFFAFDSGFFATSGVDAPPLHALQSGVAGPNGVFKYGPSGFPAEGGASNYWIDVVLQTDLGPDVTPPGVASVVPANGATGVALSSPARAAFSEGMDAATINESTFEARDETGALLSGVVSYDASTRTATFATTAGLLPQFGYTATVKGGPDGVRDQAGNALAFDFVWGFTTGNPAPPADDGPGGPILVVSSSSNPFSRYYAEILRTEGLNEFITTDISLVTPAILGSSDVVLLGEIPLTAAQVAMLSDYVFAGGNLVAMRPDKQLAGLLGLTNQSATLSNAYLQINTSSQPGAGIVSETIQFHGTADRYTTNGAVTIATLFSDASTATTSPAVTMAAVGTNGGQAAAFTFDLARSIVYTRQGNPAWSGRERDGNGPIRSDDLFFGAAAGDVQPDWVDLNKVAIPQADEQQRLLANLVLHLNRARKPLPRFWYLPRSLKAAIVMTGDDHARGGTVGRFNQYKALSAPGCSVADWQCIRGTSYIYNGTPGMDAATSLGFVNDGFEVALHVSSNCANWTPSSLATFYSSQLAQFRAEQPGVPPIETNRTHCIAWSDYVSQPKIELANGIRFDTNYYFFPEEWVRNRPGLFTGSAMPMRFADLDGTTIDVYQAATQMTDESGQIYPFTADTLLDRALGPLGYYGVFTTNHHTDLPTIQQSDATVASAVARNVPVVSAKQMLDWLDGRNGSSFGSVAWNPGQLTFTIAAHPAANGLTAMVPSHARGGVLTGLTRDGAPVVFDVQVVKGVEYAFFAAGSGSYTATYFVDVTPPVISGVAATPGLGNTAAITWTTDEPADSRVNFGISPSALTGEAGSALLVASHNITLDGLSPSTTYYFRVASSDGAGNAAAPVAGSFTMPAAVFAATDTTVADFGAGTLDGQVYVAQSADGEVILRPAAGSEFPGAALPLDWSATAWAPGGSATVSGGALTVDGARAGTIASYPAGRSLEFVATFTGAPFQHAGFGDTFAATPWAMFSTAAGTGLFARTDSGALNSSTALPSSLLGSPHRFRIDWSPVDVVYSVDGAVVATHAVAIGALMRPLVSDLAPGTGAVTVDWMRMGPYASGGTFLSRVFDAGTAVNWGALSWTVQVPLGGGAAFLARHGDTPAPDATWTPFAPIAGTGGPIGGSSRYLQYRVDLTSSDPGSTPSVEQVTVGYSEIAPNHSPVAADDTFNGTEDIALTVAAPGVLANDTDAEADPLSASLVSGPSHGTLALQADGSFTYTPAPGFFGADAFTYKANDGTSDSNAASVAIAIAAVNDLPAANADTYSTDEDTPLTVTAPGVLANDTDADGDALSAILVSGPSHGTLALQADGSFTYTPAPGFSGADAFTYRANDGGSESNVASVAIAIAAVNDLPAANADTYSTSEDTLLTVNAPGVLANDTDADGDALSAILVSGPTHGTLALQPDGSFTYTPAADFSGADSFTYKSNDGTSDSNVASVAIAIAAVNDLPVANADTYSTSEDTLLTVTAPGVLANDTDADGDALSASLVAGPTHGTLALQADGSFTYTPAPGFSGADSFTYKSNDGTSDSNVASVAIAIAAVNDLPAATADTYSTSEDTLLTVNAPGVLANDTDADGDALSASLVAGPTHGTLALQADGSFTYTPAPGFSGADAFTYKAHDGTSDSNVASVAIAIAAVNDLPAATADTYSTDEDTLLTVTAPGVLANDSDPLGRVLTAILVRAPLHGTLTKFAANGSFKYKPALNFNGTDTLVYRAAAGSDRSADTTVTIAVAPVNDKPVAADDIYRNDECHTIDVPAPGVLGNDTDVEGATLTAVLITKPYHGTLTFRPDGSFTYTSNSTFHGSDTFTYRASDGSKKSTVATVTITGLTSHPEFDALPDSYTVAAGTSLSVAAPGVLINDFDPDGESLTAVLVTATSHGTLTLNADGSFVYTPASGFTGTDSFVYRAMDEASALTAPTIVTIAVQ